MTIKSSNKIIKRPQKREKKKNSGVNRYCSGNSGAKILLAVIVMFLLDVIWFVILSLGDLEREKTIRKENEKDIEAAIKVPWDSGTDLKLKILILLNIY